MKDWANQACDCSRLPSRQSPDCVDRIKEPAIPSSFFDKLSPHPKYYQVQRYYADARQACLDGVQAREGAHP
ncbi:MAG: hypothetical protein JWO86_4524 [Myxococcaceae bacterium]|nr:hypothetical protein [Myxococcaceae bacterium]